MKVFRENEGARTYNKLISDKARRKARARTSLGARKGGAVAHANGHACACTRASCYPRSHLKWLIHFSALNKDPRCLKSFIKTYC